MARSHLGQDEDSPRARWMSKARFNHRPVEDWFQDYVAKQAAELDAQRAQLASEEALQAQIARLQGRHAYQAPDGGKGVNGPQYGF